MTENEPVLQLSDLKKHFSQDTSFIDTLLRRTGEPIPAVDGVSLTLESNTVSGVIGESGCGKTTLLMTLIGLHDITDGEIYYNGQPVSEFGKKNWKEYRRNVQIIFQDPFNSLDPKMTVEEALKEPLKIHNIGNQDRRVYEILEDVELDPPERYLHQYPDELSGGEKQRVSIGRALIVEPDIILADEPVSMLDVSTQAAILKLLSKLIDDFGVAMFYISHDLSTVAYVCDDINVMYLGQIVESAPTIELLENPKHPYTQSLISAIPIPDPHSDRTRTQLEGDVPDPGDIEVGCRFKNRCPEQMKICEKDPASVEVEEDHEVACHLYYDHEEREDPTESRGVSVEAGVSDQ